MTPTGRDLALEGTHVNQPTYRNWERYLLGRLGAVPGFSVPLADNEKIYTVIDIAEILGCAEIHGWMTNGKVRAGKSAEDRRQAIRTGFEALRDGRSGIHNLLERYVRSSGSSFDRRKVNFASYRLWGWLYQAVEKLPQSHLSAVLRSLMTQAAASNGVYSRKRKVELGTSVPVTLNQLAKRLSVKPRKVREIAAKLQILVEIRDRSECHSFSPEAVTEICETLSALIPFSEAANLVGLSEKEFRQQICSGGVVPFVRLGGGVASFDRFRHADLLAYVEGRLTEIST